MSPAAGRRRWARAAVISGALVLVAGLGVSVAAANAAVPPARGAAAVVPAQDDQGDGNDQPTPEPSGTDAGAPQAAAIDQQAAARAAARQRAQAAENAAERAEAARKINLSWVQRGKPARMVIVRAGRLDLVAAGQLDQQVPRGAGPVTLSMLSRLLPGTWMTLANGTALLNAAVVLTPGVTLDLGGDATVLQLAGGPTPPDAAAIHSGSGTIAVHGITVTSVDPGTRQPLPVAAAGRPFLAVATNGTLTATDATFTDLGTAPVGTDNGRAALAFSKGSKGSLVRTALLRNTIGLELTHSQAVHLEDLSVSESSGDGIVLDGDVDTTMRGIKAERNDGNGVLVTGESSTRPITGITTTGNKAFGVAVVGQAQPQVFGIATTADRSGGLRLSRTTGAVVHDVRATEQPIGVFTHVNTTGTVMDGIHVTGGRRGLVAEKSTRDLQVRSSTFDGTRVTGISLGGHAISLKGVSVTGSRAALRVERGAGEITVDGLSISGGRDGVVLTGGTTGVVLQNVEANHVASAAVRSSSPGATIVGGRIRGGSTGIDVDAPTTISHTVISLSDEGVHSRSPQLVVSDQVDIDAIHVGIDNAAAGPFQLTGSRVHALEAVRGDVGVTGFNEVSLPPLNLLGAIGVPLILLAIGLELIHSTLQRRRSGQSGRRRPPAVPVAAG